MSDEELMRELIRYGSVFVDVYFEDRKGNGSSYRFRKIFYHGQLFVTLMENGKLLLFERK